MNWEVLVEAVVAQPWVESAGKAVQGAVRSVYQTAGPVGQQVENFLHGIWLGHPLHAVLTDVPLGAWTTALALDALEAAGHEEFGPGADTAVAVGLAGALGAATAGLTDWYPLGSERRHVGTVHMLLNVSATALYTASLVMRKSGQRGAGRLAAGAGFAVVTVGAYLGGHLVYDQQTGVKHAVEAAPPADFTPALAEADLREGQLRCVDVAGTPVLLTRRNGVIYALGDTCTHLGCSLAEGELIEDSVRCVCHGSRFALEDGRVLDGPSTYWQPVYRVRARAGQIEIGKPMD
jgi:nitrite reductase/ring-hydroxylating ferredoxin subunit/uncharacterized membrane protein